MGRDAHALRKDEVGTGGGGSRDASPLDTPRRSTFKTPLLAVQASPDSPRSRTSACRRDSLKASNAAPIPSVGARPKMNSPPEEPLGISPPRWQREILKVSFAPSSSVLPITPRLPKDGE